MPIAQMEDVPCILNNYTFVNQEAIAIQLVMAFFILGVVLPFKFNYLYQ